MTDQKSDREVISEVLLGIAIVIIIALIFL